MLSQGNWRRLVYPLLALGVTICCCARAPADDLFRFAYHVLGDSKPIVLHANQITTWLEGGQRIILLSGRILLEHGVVQSRAQQAVVWVDAQRSQKTGIQRIAVYAEGEVTIENGPEARSQSRAFLEISTRGELRLKAHSGKIAQEAVPQDPFYRRAREARDSLVQKPAAGPVRQASFQQSVPAPGPTPVPAPVLPPRPPAADPPAVMPPAGTSSPAPPAVMPPAGTSSPAPPAVAPPGVPPTRPAAIPAPGAPPRSGPTALLNSPIRQFKILPRTAAGYDPISFPLGNEHVIVISGGVILLVRTGDNNGLLDIEADRVVLWTHSNPQELLSNLRSQEGQSSRELEIYLAGNVELRHQEGKESHTLKADEVYYDVARNVAVAMKADLEFRQPGLPDPVHLRAEELQQLSPDLFKGVKAEVFSSRLPSDPGLKVYVAEATLEQKKIAKRSVFGREVVDRRTGQPETEQQRLFDGTNVLLKVEDIPVFYLPFLRGDANDPLGPLESANINYNRVFGAQIATTFNVYDLLGLDPVPDTRWRLNVDYLSRRGPALGTDFEYHTKNFLGAPARVDGLVKAYGIYDTATDILGGFRGPQDDHPDARGRFFWRQNVLDLPDGFTFQTQISALSDKNFLEQYYKNEFDTDINQETFLYLKQQQNNWAWTLLTESNIRNWVNETEWLPRVDGYLIGQSFFDLFTYNAHASAGYARLRTTDVPPPPESITTAGTDTGRFDLGQELSLPFSLGAFRIVPYGTMDLTYYNEDLTGSDQGRFYGGGGVRSSIPFTRLFPEIKSDLLNLDGINHKIVFGSNYFIAHSDTPYYRLPQLDRLNDDASDQSLRDIKPIEPFINPAHGIALATSPLFDPQTYAIRRLVDDRIDTLDTIQVLEADVRQRLQTKRGYPGQEHIVDWMTLDLSGSYFPNSQRDNFGENFAFLQYDWTWNVGDRTALVSSGWFDPHDQGARVFSVGTFINRPDRTSFYVGYRQIDPLNSQAVSGAVTYIFSPKYAMTANAVYDFGVNTEVTSIIFTRMGTDLQLSLGATYNSLTSSFGLVFEIVPNIVPPSHRFPGLTGIGQSLAGR